MDVIQATHQVRLLSTASTALVIYEYFLTLDQEINFFWAGPWGISKVLFLANRYLTPLNLALLLFCETTFDPSPNFCNVMYRVMFTFWFFLILIAQAVLVLRVWYLYLRSPWLRRLVIAMFTASTLSTIAALVIYFRPVHPFPFPQKIMGCPGPGPSPAPALWPVLLPSFVLHTILFLLTAYIGLTCGHLMESPLLRRLVRDGGIFYMTVFCCAGYSMISSRVGGFELRVASVLSELPFTVISVAITRTMLSLRSLAAHSPQPDDWITEMVELRQTRFMNTKGSGSYWRRGQHGKEFLVEVDAHPGEEDMEEELERRSRSTSEAMNRLAELRTARELVVGGYARRHYF